MRPRIKKTMEKDTEMFGGERRSYSHHEGRNEERGGNHRDSFRGGRKYNHDENHGKNYESRDGYKRNDRDGYKRNDRDGFKGNRRDGDRKFSDHHDSRNFKKNKDFKNKDYKGRDYKGRDYKGRDFKNRDFKSREFNTKHSEKVEETFVQPQPPKLNADGKIRLNKYLSNAGICSRREADEYITAGLVSVNGEIVTELGVKVSPEDEVRFNGERIKSERKVYVLMNKPKDFVTTMSDPHAEKNVMQLISPDLCPERIFPVGRLDKSTTGVLLLTNDGELTERLTHPSFQKKKIYQVTLDRNLRSSDMDMLAEGVELEDGVAYADEISYVGEDKDVIGIEIHSGKNRIVRRMFESLGYKVYKLDRVYFAGLTKKNLRRGQWRFLSEEEISMLKMNFYE